MTSARLIHRFNLRDYVAPQAFYHVARNDIPATSQNRLHTHDFAEVFWIERGEGWHHINGQKVGLRAGDVVFIRPTDAHCFRAHSQSTHKVMREVNVAFSRNTLERIRRRYFRSRTAAWPWWDAPLPVQVSADPVALRQLSQWALTLSRSNQTRLLLDCFLLNVLLLLPTRSANSDASHLPDWLRLALLEFERPENVAGGAARLAELSGRCAEHINRTFRQCLGQTTTDVLNDLRLRLAAHRLSMTSAPILEIALDTGWENLGYFYRLFNRKYGLTPRRYRQHAHTITSGRTHP